MTRISSYIDSSGGPTRNFFVGAALRPPDQLRCRFARASIDV
jgi:hypothetical protein